MNYSVSYENLVTICWFLRDDSFNMAAMDEYALEKVQFSPDRRYVKKDATKYVLLGSTNIHIFRLTYSKHVFSVKTFFFKKEHEKYTKLLIVLK